MPSYLDEIVSFHRRLADEDTRSLADLEANAHAVVKHNSFAEALRSKSPRMSVQSTPPLMPAVIAEFKRRSPSKGLLALEADPAKVAGEYELGGATCLSVLTDEHFFGGSADDLLAAKEFTRLPILRKDFIVSDADVYDTKIMGADALLLIVAALHKNELFRFSKIASELGMSVLVEVHDEQELDISLQYTFQCKDKLIGVNQRNLETFEVDTTKAQQMSALIPDDLLKVAESGITSSLDAARLGECGFDAVLVGELFMKANDRTKAVMALSGKMEKLNGRRR
ncbi:MAG: indole-3-glycerol phosphate synthase TrpC [Actinobacteria bacterium]|nr:indole-3-glycerol phosphate synthase TrpC [Actinomycetota bacterium]MCL6105456.1 indole-3-glycerol phosphate synthase TrpC [Actinomycetota bacterium]